VPQPMAPDPAAAATTTRSRRWRAPLAAFGPSLFQRHCCLA